MRFVVTGATGLLGANLAVLLREAGHDVRCTRRGRSRTAHLDGHGVDWIEADVTDGESLPRAFDGADGVFHCAAAVSVRRAPTADLVTTNVDGTRHVAEAVRRASVGRPVHCSSTVAVGLGVDGQPADESATWNLDQQGLDDGYSVSKRRAEQVPGSSTGFNNFVDVRDVGRSMLAAHARGRRGERYILGGHNLTYTEIFRRIAAVAGVAPPRFVFPRWAAAPVGWVGDLTQAITGREPLLNSNAVAWGYEPDFRFSSAKAERELGHAISPIENAIADALAWFRAHGILKG